jgi:hypothetical protein
MPLAVTICAPWPWIRRSNPFNCELQQAGFEALGPDPAADPYCVGFEKTRQNVTEFGLLDFLMKEPARVAAALPKCFYYQADHWRGSIVQDDDRTKLYEFRGRYFFRQGARRGRRPHRGPRSRRAARLEQRLPRAP